MSEDRLRAAITELVEALVEDVRERTGAPSAPASEPAPREPAEVRVDEVAAAKARRALRRLGVL